jgi:hypothetical protein
LNGLIQKVAKKNQSNRLTKQHKQSHCLVSGKKIKPAIGGKE